MVRAAPLSSPSSTLAWSSRNTQRCRARIPTTRDERKQDRNRATAVAAVVVAAASGINGDDNGKALPPLNGHAAPNGVPYNANGAASAPQQQTPTPSFTWDADAFPAYLQSEVDDFCSDWELALTEAEQRQQMRKANEEREEPETDDERDEGATTARPATTSPPTDATSRQPPNRHSSSPVSPNDPVWLAIRREAQRDAADEPLLSSFLYASVLSHPGFARSLAFVLANRLSDATLLATELMEVFESVLAACPWVQRSALADIVAVRERDPACRSYADGLLYFKGYQAIQVHRIAHELWLGEREQGEADGRGGRVGGGRSSGSRGVRASRVMARMLQSRVSEVFAVDIHPAATLGRGLLLDHGTGVVIGETAVVGDNVSILQNVTLGGTGKDAGDRHPKVEDNVLIGAAATILGNIVVGRGAQVAAGSLVLKPVPPRTAVAGSPAQVVGPVRGNPALRMQQWVASLDGKSAPAWESAMCPPPTADEARRRTPTAAGDGDAAPALAGSAPPPSRPPPSPPSSSPSDRATAAASGSGQGDDVGEINRKIYPRRTTRPTTATAEATRTPPPPPPPALPRPDPPPRPPPSSKPKQARKEPEPEFFI